jgi:hypothetical protein
VSLSLKPNVSSITFDNYTSIATLAWPSTSNFTVNSITTIPGANEPTNPYIQFDLGEDKTIKFIKITSADTSINGTTLYLVNSNGIIT